MIEISMKLPHGFLDLVIPFPYNMCFTIFYLPAPKQYEFCEAILTTDPYVYRRFHSFILYWFSQDIFNFVLDGCLHWRSCQLQVFLFLFHYLTSFFIMMFDFCRVALILLLLVIVYVILAFACHGLTLPTCLKWGLLDQHHIFRPETLFCNFFILINLGVKLGCVFWHGFHPWYVLIVWYPWAYKQAKTLGLIM